MVLLCVEACHCYNIYNTHLLAVYNFLQKYSGIVESYAILEFVKPALEICIS